MKNWGIAMDKDMIQDELCVLDLDVKSPDEFFEVIGKKTLELGYTTKNFTEGLKKREALFPTALPTTPKPIAIPHSDPENIVKQFIAPVRLKNPIQWQEMANNGHFLEVKYVFLLGFKREEGHVELLQLLLKNVQDEELMNKLQNAKTEKEYVQIVRSMKGLSNNL